MNAYLAQQVKYSPASQALRAYILWLGTIIVLVAASAWNMQLAPCIVASVVFVVGMFSRTIQRQNQSLSLRARGVAVCCALIPILILAFGLMYGVFTGATAAGLTQLAKPSSVHVVDSEPLDPAPAEVAAIAIQQSRPAAGRAPPLVATLPYPPVGLLSLLALLLGSLIAPRAPPRVIPTATIALSTFIAVHKESQTHDHPYHSGQC